MASRRSAVLLAASAALVLLAGPMAAAAAAQGLRGDELIAIHRTLNGMCRGWPGDDPRTQEVCELRERVGTLLKQTGYCHGRRGQTGAQMGWHRCGPDSLR